MKKQTKDKQTKDKQKARCDRCEYKELEHHGLWCYMFREFMPNCMKFSPNKEKVVFVDFITGNPKFHTNSFYYISNVRFVLAARTHSYLHRDGLWRPSTVTNNDIASGQYGSISEAVRVAESLGYNVELRPGVV